MPAHGRKGSLTKTPCHRPNFVFLLCSRSTQPPPRPKPSNPIPIGPCPRVGQVLGLVRTLIAYGRNLAATLQLTRRRSASPSLLRLRGHNLHGPGTDPAIPSFRQHRPTPGTSPLPLRAWAAKQTKVGGWNQWMDHDPQRTTGPVHASPASDAYPLPSLGPEVASNPGSVLAMQSRWTRYFIP